VRVCGKRIFTIDKRNLNGYILVVIKSFDHKGLEKFYYDGDKGGIQPTHAQRIADILDRLDAAVTIQDMKYPGSNLHQLKGKLKGVWSVEVSGNWRVTFRFRDGNAYVVDYRDYH
jgi:proteic killer suppression protein